MFDVAREADPSRPVEFVNVMLAPYRKCRVSQFADVLMLNRYYGWYVHAGDLAAAEPAWQAELDAWAREGKPIIIAEHGSWKRHSRREVSVAGHTVSGMDDITDFGADLHPVGVQLQRLRRQLQELAEMPVFGIPDQQLPELVCAARAVVSQAQPVYLNLLAQADAW